MPGVVHGGGDGVGHLLNQSFHHEGDVDECGFQIRVGFASGEHGPLWAMGSRGRGRQSVDREEGPKQGDQDGLQRSLGNCGAVDQVFVLDDLLREDQFGEGSGSQLKKDRTGNSNK